jgi:hypothetical protein
MTLPVVAVGNPSAGVSPRARRLILALVIAGLLVVAGGLLAGFDRSRSPSAVAAARHENSVLRARQEVLRESAFVLAGRVVEAALACEIAADRVGVGAWRAPVPAPAAAREVLACDAAVPPAADRGSPEATMSIAGETSKTTR